MPTVNLSKRPGYEANRRHSNELLCDILGLRVVELCVSLPRLPQHLRQEYLGLDVVVVVIVTVVDSLSDNMDVGRKPRNKDSGPR